MAALSKSFIGKASWALFSVLMGRLAAVFLPANHIRNFFDWFFHSPITVAQVVVFAIVVIMGYMFFFSKKDASHTPETLAQAMQQSEGQIDSMKNQIAQTVGTERCYTDGNGNPLFTLYYQIGKKSLYGDGYFAYNIEALCNLHNTKISQHGYCSNPTCRFHDTPIPIQRLKDEIEGEILKAYHQLQPTKSIQS